MRKRSFINWLIETQEFPSYKAAQMGLHAHQAERLVQTDLETIVFDPPKLGAVLDRIRTFPGLPEVNSKQLQFALGLYIQFGREE